MGRRRSVSRSLTLGAVVFAAVGAARAQKPAAAPPAATAQSHSTAAAKAKSAAPAKASISGTEHKPIAQQSAAPAAATAPAAPPPAFCTLATPSSCLFVGAAGSFDPGRNDLLPGGGAWVQFGYGGSIGRRLGVAQYYQLGFDDIGGHLAGNFAVGVRLLLDPRARPHQLPRSGFLMPFMDVGVGDRTGAPFHAYFPVGVGVYWVTPHRAMPYIELRDIVPVGHTNWPAGPEFVVGVTLGYFDS